ncbi:MAG: GntR family transcriptional regulator [Hyphomicrobiales bacterium]|nr:GntR family transcriptional regulator [Hyphomicrobiales bacterium]
MTVVSEREINASLTNQVALRIVDYIERNHLQRGEHLAAQRFADAFKVSRSPVRNALLKLSSLNVVEAHRNRGFFLAAARSALPEVRRLISVPLEDELYLGVAQDRLIGRLADRVTEAELARRYPVTRSQLRRMLARMAKEGWVARKPGYGWQFLPVLTSREAVFQSYSFRKAVEPAAILEPGYHMDEKIYLHCRAQQSELLGADMERLTPVHVFELGCDFHETVVGCSGNPYALDELRRQNRLRRLMEYRITLDKDRIQRQCREHLEIIDRIEAGDCPGAAELMRRHLDISGYVKAKYHDEHPLPPPAPANL